MTAFAARCIELDHNTPAIAQCLEFAQELVASHDLIIGRKRPDVKKADAGAGRAAAGAEALAAAWCGDEDDGICVGCAAVDIKRPCAAGGGGTEIVEGACGEAPGAALDGGPGDGVRAGGSGTGRDDTGALQRAAVEAGRECDLGQAAPGVAGSGGGAARVARTTASVLCTDGIPEPLNADSMRMAVGAGFRHVNYQDRWWGRVSGGGENKI